jgi:rhamnogalacturonan endolyase
MELSRGKFCLAEPLQSTANRRRRNPTNFCPHRRYLLEVEPFGEEDMSFRCLLVVLASMLVSGIQPLRAQRQMEYLGRGVVAINQGDGKVFVSWRMLGTDPDGIAFNVYHKSGSAAAVKLNPQPIADVTFLQDSDVKLDQATAYFVRAVLNGQEGAPSQAFEMSASAPARPYLAIPMKSPQGYAPNDASAADLDGDGEYELVVHMTGRARDNSQAGQTDAPILQAYKLDGTMLWEINLGPNIRDGAHYTQFMVYDFDGDGRAEMICKTADGTKDGRGTVIGDAKANYVNSGGHVLKGPEFLTLFDGLSGAALDTVAYVPRRTLDNPDDPQGNTLQQMWGDRGQNPESWGNRGERYLACVAYLDGVHPSAVMCRGYYTRTFLCAWDVRDKKLVQRWLFDSGPDKQSPYSGQGNHNLSVADVDGDGKDEIVYGACVIDDNGKGLWSTGYGHGDAIHVGDLDPDNPGLEVFDIQERFADAGAHMEDLKSGKTLWKKPSVAAATSGGDRGEGPGRGVCFNIDPRYPGSESWTAGAGIQGVWDAKGNVIGNVKPNSCNFRIYWDGDMLDELLDKNTISKWNYEREKAEPILVADGCTSNNGTKATPTLSADILGDWREELILRTTDNTELRIFTTTIPTKHRLYTLMHDPQYRLAIAWQNVAYNQPPHVSFYTDEKMPKPPKPNITLIAPQSGPR